VTDETMTLLMVAGLVSVGLALSALALESWTDT